MKRELKKLRNKVPVGVLILRETPWAWNPEEAYGLLESGRVKLRQGGKEWTATPEDEVEGRFEISLAPKDGEGSLTMWRIVDA